MNKEERTKMNIAHCFCYGRYCNECPLRKPADLKHISCYQLPFKLMQKICIEAYKNHDKALMESIKRDNKYSETFKEVVFNAIQFGR